MLKQTLTLIASFFLLTSVQAQDIAGVVKVMYAGHDYFRSQEMSASGFSKVKTAENVMAELTASNPEKEVDGVTFKVVKTEGNQVLINIKGEPKEIKNYSLEPAGEDNQLFKNRSRNELPYPLYQAFNEKELSEEELQSLSEEKGKALFDMTNGIMTSIKATGDIKKILILKKN